MMSVCDFLPDENSLDSENDGKEQYTKDMQKQAAVDGVKLLMIDDLFSIEQ